MTGKRVLPVFDFKKANVVVSLGHDFLGDLLLQTKYTNDFSSRRDPDLGKDNLNRLYVVEDRVTVTGAKADHRFSLSINDQLAVLRRLVYFLSKRVNFNLDSSLDLSTSELSNNEIDDKLVEIIVDDLLENRGKSIVTVSSFYSREFHQLCFLINSILSNNFKTISYVTHQSLNADYMRVNNSDSIKSLVKKLNDNKIDTLVIVGGNPVYSVPDSIGLKNALVKANNRVHLTSLVNESSLLCNWVIPRAHAFESWSDLKTLEGLQQYVSQSSRG